MRISGKTRLLGIVGSRIDYTLSPKIHNFSISQRSMDQIYVPFNLIEGSLANFLQSFWDVGGVGLNITTPFKAEAARLVKTEADSVNTLFRGNDGWLGASTDGPGFANGLERDGIVPEQVDRLIFLGNGGVVAALISYLENSKRWQPKEIHVLGRNPKSFLTKRLNVSTHPFGCHSLSETIKKSSTRSLLVQATNAPSKGDTLSELIPALEPYQGAFVDLLYANQSDLLSWAKKQGLKCQDGMPMLIEQARLSQELWWGSSCDYAKIWRELSG